MHTVNYGDILTSHASGIYTSSVPSSHCNGLTSRPLPSTSTFYPNISRMVNYQDPAVLVHDYCANTLEALKLTDSFDSGSVGNLACHSRTLLVCLPRRTALYSPQCFQ